MTGKDNHPLKIIPEKRKIITIQFPIFVAINKEIKILWHKAHVKYKHKPSNKYRLYLHNKYW